MMNRKLSEVMMTKAETTQTETIRHSGANRHSDHLLGKVVLIIGNDSAVLKKLITQLAQKGADIAIICQDLPSEALSRLRETVELLGRRFLLIYETASKASVENKHLKAEHSVQTVINRFGHLDIFIDLSAQKKKQKQPDNKNTLVMNKDQPDWSPRYDVIRALVQT